jgi:hypothetical protein
MQPLGWLMLVVSVGGVWALTLWCYLKVFSLPPAEEAEIAETVKDFHSA